MVFRVLFIIINTILIFFTFQYRNLVITPLVLSGILLIQIYNIYIKEKHDQEKIIAYLESVILEETSNSTSSDKKSIYFKINNAVEQINDRFIQSNIENQEKANLLNAFLEHIDMGLITFNSDGEVGILNKTARNLLSINYLSNIKETDLFRLEDTDGMLDFSSKIKKIITMKDNNSIYVESSNFILHEEQIRIISLQNIKKTLDEKEMDSWNLLIRTLNHEIMNSITPISSLASSALSLLENEHNSDLIEAVETIERRSRNLLKFVENYKTLSQIPKPQKELILVRDLIKRISILMSSFAEQSDTILNCFTEDKQLMIFADSTQLEQILINLVKNSVEASASEITLKGEAANNSDVMISITDNGSGFSSESESKAFIPFYTTKPNGSGLGLSIVRQIMHLHNGEVKIKSDKNGSTVSLLFS